MHIRGSAQLAVMPLNGLRAPVHFHADRLYGDKSGFLHVGYHQNFSVAVTDPDIPFGLRVYENGSMMLPRRAFLQTVSFKSSGKVDTLYTLPTSIHSISFNKTAYYVTRQHYCFFLIFNFIFYYYFFVIIKQFYLQDDHLHYLQY